MTKLDEEYFKIYQKYSFKLRFARLNTSLEVLTYFLKGNYQNLTEICAYITN